MIKLSSRLVAVFERCPVFTLKKKICDPQKTSYPKFCLANDIKFADPWAVVDSRSQFFSHPST